MKADKNIAIIPARGGSKRIPRKNIKLFSGKPVISYAIEAARMSNLFDEIIVSTEDEEIAGIARKYGAKVPFMRSAKNADDVSSTTDVLLEVLSEYEKTGHRFDFGCCIYPATPLLTEKLLQKSCQLVKTYGFDSVFPVLRYSYPIQRSLKIESGKISMMWPEYQYSRSQDLTDTYHDAGQFYWFSIHEFLLKRNIWTDNTGAIVISEWEAHDIDTMDDWELAEFKYEYRKRLQKE